MDRRKKIGSNLISIADLVENNHDDYQELLNFMMTINHKTVDPHMTPQELNTLAYSEDLCRLFINTASQIKFLKKKHKG